MDHKACIKVLGLSAFLLIFLLYKIQNLLLLISGCMKMMKSCWSGFLNLLRIVLVVTCSTNTLRSFFNLLLLVLKYWCNMNTLRLHVAVGGHVKHGLGQCGGGGGGAGDWVSWDVELAVHQ